MKFIDLEPQFVRKTAEGWTESSDGPSGADGVRFLCPKCFLQNNGPVGTHSVLCWAPHMSDNLEPKPGRWLPVGTGLVDLSLVACPTSVQLGSGCKAHFIVANGEVTFA
jgi:hypothetical protein